MYGNGTKHISNVNRRRANYNYKQFFLEEATASRQRRLAYDVKKSLLVAIFFLKKNLQFVSALTLNIQKMSPYQPVNNKQQFYFQIYFQK